MLEISELHKSSFAPYVNQIFTIHSSELGPQEVVLAELSEKNYPGQECFSLILRGPKQPVMQQMNYLISHPQMGEMQLFMVPIHYHKQDGMYYQIGFNRLLDK